MLQHLNHDPSVMPAQKAQCHAVTAQAPQSSRDINPFPAGVETFIPDSVGIVHLEVIQRRVQSEGLRERKESSRWCSFPKRTGGMAAALPWHNSISTFGGIVSER